jgi:ATP-dependent 26S proteasome regulatory subunit
MLDDKSGNWDDLVLPSDIRSLVRRDFESFFEREEWFRKHHLPFRRGYLFYGSPGNGKTSVIHAMANRPGLSLFSANFNNKEVDDSAVASMFESARNSAPALVILEDLDRTFPRDGSRKEEVKVSLSGLLNSLDGVTVQEGLIVAATANNPERLDPAILNRPGRFDRVIEFRDPSAEVRAGYFQKIGGLDTNSAAEIVESTDGFSFAQLREIYILAGQFAFEEEREIESFDLLQAAAAMRSQSCRARGGLGAKVGFGPK